MAIHKCAGVPAAYRPGQQLQYPKLHNLDILSIFRIGVRSQSNICDNILIDVLYSKEDQSYLDVGQSKR